MRTNVRSSDVETLKTHFKRMSALGFAATVLLFCAAPSWGTESAVAPGPKDLSHTVPLYTNLGSHHKPISTQVAATQQYFDQGLRFMYGFNHAEAIRSFTRAAELDPTCAMCYWGIALAYGPNVNAPMDSASGVAAYAAVQKAMTLRSHAPEPERHNIEAVAPRYEAVPPTERARLHTAFSRAMNRVVNTYPDDLDAATLYAESLMDLRPWMANGPGELKAAARRAANSGPVAMTISGLPRLSRAPIWPTVSSSTQSVTPVSMPGRPFVCDVVGCVMVRAFILR